MGRCIACGLCSFVCPSKLELREEFVDARGRLAAELAEAQRAEAQRVAAQRAEAEQAEGQA
ncbi:MAG TPA: 4Fe-4S dicluster domain-containing protein [Phycisphaerae bacterium]|nr:4Fe-4S dicluster domain-containing protein [Phycisphaerae bacterium]